MADAFLCAGVRTPIGRYGGALASMRADDLAAAPITGLIRRHPGVNWAAVDDVILGCANQAGEDNRNVARMALLLAGLPASVPGVTVNRLCGSGLEAVAQAARAIRCGEASLVIAGGAESMSRAPYVVAKAEAGYARGQAMADTTLGWRLVNPRMKSLHGTDALALTAETVAAEHGVSRADQDAFALGSQKRARVARDSGRLAHEIIAIAVRQRRGEPVIVARDEHPRPETTLEKLAALPALAPEGGTVTAGNASGINDGAAALIVASEDAAAANGLTPMARVVGAAAAGVPPRIMGMGPVPATRALLGRLGLTLDAFTLIEINEAFAAQTLACLRALGVADDDPRVNPNGGAIALGHPLGMSGARLALTAAMEIEGRGGHRALCTMCIGVGQGLSLVLEGV